VDAAVALGLVLAAGEWRSPFYLLAVTTLILPATTLRPRQALAFGIAFAAAYFVIALVTGIEWETLGSTARLESFATHLVIPLLVVVSLAYASDLVDDLERERRHSEALALEAERRRIGWELHDSAKQRIHAAQLVLSSLAGGEDRAEEPRLRIALDELEQAVRDIDASLTELRTSLGGQRLEEAVARRAAELQAVSGIAIDVHGETPPLPTFVAVHAYRVACEAVVNAVRHARPTRVDVDVAVRDGRLELSVTDDGIGLPPDASSGSSTGLRSMEVRARTLGGALRVGAAQGGGTRIELSAPALRPADRTQS
jgi:signal transduction histidine kinase